MKDIFDRFHQTTRGSVERPKFYEHFLTGAFDYRDGPDKKLRAAVHLDAAGQPDGYVTYKPGDRKDTGRAIEVTDLVALTPQAYAASGASSPTSTSPTRSPGRAPRSTTRLEWSLVEPRVVKVTTIKDLLWVRLLDVAAALEARPWGADGEIVLDVADQLGHAAGRFRVTTSGGQAKVDRTDEAPGVLLEADTLGSLYLGDVGADTLHAAGRVTGEDEAVRDFAGMSDVGPAPYCITGF